MAVREWASDATWTSGPDNGDDTKVSPANGVVAQGFVPGVPFSADEMNAEFNSWTRGIRAIEQRQIEMHSVGTNATISISSFAPLNVLYTHDVNEIFEIYDNLGSFQVHQDGDFLNVTRTAYNAGTITFDVATNGGSRNFCVVDTNPGFQTHVRGQSYGAVTGDMTAAQDPSNVVYDATNDQMVVTGGGDEFIALCSGGSYNTFTVPVGPSFGNSLGNRAAAVLGSLILVSGVDGDDNRAYDFDGTSTVTARGNLPTVAGGTEAAFISASNNLFFWAQEEPLGGGDFEVVVYTSADGGATWSPVLNHALIPTETVAAGRMHLKFDPYSGAMYLIVGCENPGGIIDDHTEVLFTLDDGATWSTVYRATRRADKFDVAGGYLWSYEESTQDLRRSTVRLPAV